MFALTKKPEMAARLYTQLVDMASEPGNGTDAIKVIQYLAGVLVETYMVFDRPDQTMEAGFYKLSRLLGCEPMPGLVMPGALPPAHILDLETERGRAAARMFFEDWLDCEYEFHDLMLALTQNIFVRWEEEGFRRAESFRLLTECVKRCMAFEIAAQELCDVVIERQVGIYGWGLSDCVASLSAVAGRRLALSLKGADSAVIQGAELPETLDRIIYVMTQEAVRLGVPAGSDWRFGLAANDVPADAPMELILAIEPYCRSFFNAIKMYDRYDQAVACAKAAGRMLAVAAGGETPELEPVIAKPLAMAAMTETYKSVCMTHSRISL